MKQRMWNKVVAPIVVMEGGAERETHNFTSFKLAAVYSDIVLPSALLIVPVTMYLNIFMSFNMWRIGIIGYI